MGGGARARSTALLPVMEIAPPLAAYGILFDRRMILERRALWPASVNTMFRGCSSAAFFHDPSQQAERTWLHRRPIEPRLVSIRDVGVEEWFYSKKSSGGELTLDDIITNIESDLSGTINDLRATPIGSAVNSDIAAHFVVHLVMRTNHLRTLMSKGFWGVSEKIQSIFSDPSSLERECLGSILMKLHHASPKAFGARHLNLLLAEFQSRSRNE